MKENFERIFKNTLASIKRTNPNHPIFNLGAREQKDFMLTLLKAQGYYVKEGIKAGTSEMALPGLGTFQYNPLRTIVNETKAEFKDKLYDFEINQLIKQRLVTFFETKKHPFKKFNAVTYSFDEPIQ